jgi:hypothetical protein
MKNEKLIDEIEDRQFELTEAERIRLLAIAFQFPHMPTTLELMALEKLLREFSV